jgi:hypothetical protein
MNRQIDLENGQGKSGSKTSGGSTQSAPVGPFGKLVATLPGNKSFSYQFTPEDVLWTARFLVGEAGGRDDPGNRAVIWAMFNRYALFTNRVYPSFHQFIRAYSTPLQPVLKSMGAARRHAHKPEFVKTGGVYPGSDVPKGQLKRHLELQQKPWSGLPAAARSLAERAMKGLVPNPIGAASEFASTWIYFKDRHKRSPLHYNEWKDFTEAHARNKKWKWVGPISGINQKSNAFFIDRRALNLQPGAIKVVASTRSVQPEILTEFSMERPRAFEMELMPDLETFLGETEFDLAQFPYPVLTLLKLKLESSAIKLAVLYGYRSETQLTDLVFNARHPERAGQAITKGETTLAGEWLTIRDSIVRPVLRTSGAPTPTPAPGPSTPITGPDVVKVRGVTVARQIAPKIEALLAAADADGVRLSGGGFRTPQQQIELRKKHCGTSRYDIYDKPANQCKPPTANPGRSNHERGLAIDFTYQGKSIDSHQNPGFQWLAANAARFGLKNLPSEPWHWSVDGR